MNIERKVGGFSYRLYDIRANGQVRHEVAIADVYLHGFSEAFDEPDFFLELGEVFGQDGGDDFY